MTEFKVGDVVKRKVGGNCGFEKGMVGIITKIYKDEGDVVDFCNVELEEKQLSINNDLRNLELVENATKCFKCEKVLKNGRKLCGACENLLFHKWGDKL